VLHEVATAAAAAILAIQRTPMARLPIAATVAVPQASRKEANFSWNVWWPHAGGALNVGPPRGGKQNVCVEKNAVGVHLTPAHEPVPKVVQCGEPLPRYRSVVSPHAVLAFTPPLGIRLAARRNGSSLRSHSLKQA
jgi:hypothetical protein